MEEIADSYVLRSLQPADYNKGYIDLLKQLTVVGDVTEEAFTRRVEELQKLGESHHVAVIEDLDRRRIIATGSIFIELKILRNCSKVGHIEDVVVDSAARGHHLGKRIVAHLKDFAKQVDCYKVTLDCADGNVPFYEKCGFHKRAVHMADYF